ncbi:MAG: urate oxidase [Verrucomicrobia bacterium]|nr:MAG: urate oxidase [Verrucomicrobiota bacterium]
MPKLNSHRYGKARVRVAKILRSKDRQSIVEIDVAAMLEGDFESSYTAAAGDNTKVVPTDTIKNTINILAKEKLSEEIEPFAIALGEHFVKRYQQVRSARIEISERDWRRMDIDGKPHPHSFAAGSDAKMFTRVVCARDSQTVESGVRDLVILKSTGSGFENYPKDEFTTLPETPDRILATSFSATWSYAKAPSSYRDRNDKMMAAMLKVFANNYSPSAQTTLFEMGTAALETCSEISRIELAMPNKHYLPIDLSKFGRENKNEVFTPTDEPHGQIEAVVTRDE